MKKNKLLVLIMILVFALSANTMAASKKLTKLENRLEKQIKGYSGTWSVYVKNLDTGASLIINNKKMYAASLIKLYALGTAYDKIEKGKLKESSVSGTLRSMITVSDNDSFNLIVKRLGTTAIDKWCEKNGYTQTQQRHGTRPASNFSGTVSRKGGTNLTSVKDVGKLLERIYKGKCVSKSASKKMRSFLRQQQRRSKIPAGIPGGVKVLNKTGETDDYTHDAAIVYSKGANYILVVMGRCPGYAWSAASKIPLISRTVYRYFN